MSYWEVQCFQQRRLNMSSRGNNSLILYCFGRVYALMDVVLEHFRTHKFHLLSSNKFQQVYFKSLGTNLLLECVDLGPPIISFLLNKVDGII
jgi:hypothetical protein